MNEQEMKEHIEILQDSLDEAMEIMLKIRSKIKALKITLQKHRNTILTTNDYNQNRKKADEILWEILDYDELFS